MNNLAKQSELLYLWDAKMCNPNGDMSADNAPRFDDVDEKAIVSDVRKKRTIRDDLQYRKNKLIFINNEEIIKGGLSAEKRFDQLKADDSKNKKDKEANEAKQIFLSCIDNRLFGGVAPKSGIQLVGTVQFCWAKSLNKTETVLKSGTGAFATESKGRKKDGEEGEGKRKTFRVDNYIPYGLFALYGTINQMQAVNSSTSEEDINEMLDSLWFGTKFLNTRSKEGQKPRLMLRIIYKEESKYFIGLLDEYVQLKNEETELIRRVEDAELDFSRLVNAINNAEQFIDQVDIVLDGSMEAYKELLQQIKNVRIINDIEFMTK